MNNIIIILFIITVTTSSSVFSMCTPPVNEQCGAAVAIAMGGCSAAGNLGCDITGDPAAPSCGPGAVGSAWYSFVVPASGNVDVTMTLTGGYYTAITLYSGACPGGLVEAGCYYPAPLANPYTGSFTGLTPGTTVFIDMAPPNVSTQTSYSSICVTDAGGGGCPDCGNGIQDCAETGVDCGGPDCAPCGGGPDCFFQGGQTICL